MHASSIPADAIERPAQRRRRAPTAVVTSMGGPLWRLRMVVGGQSANAGISGRCSPFTRS